MLYPGASLKYMYNSSAFSDKAFIGDFSYPISFPDNESNALVFGFVSNPDLYNEVTEHSCDLYENNTLFKSGIFKVTSAKKGVKISGNFINSSYDFINRIKNKTTKDIDLGGDHEFDTSADLDVYIVALQSGSYPTYKFAQFPILNEIYMDGTQEETTWESIKYINPYNPGGNDVYYPYLAYIIEQLFAEFGFRVEDVVGSHDELKKLCLIGMHEDKHVWEYTGYNLHYHVLKVDLTYLLDAIKSTLGVAYFFDNNGNNVKMKFLKDLLIPGNYVDWSDKVEGSPIKKIDKTGDGFMLSHSFDSSDETMSEMQLPTEILENVVKEDPVLTPADLPISANVGIPEGEIRYVICEEMYYISIRYGYNDSRWVRLSWTYFEKIIGDGLVEKPSQLTTLGMHWHLKKAGSAINNWMTPHSDQTLLKNPLTGTMALLGPGNLNYDLVKPVVNDFEPRVLFFRNMQPDVADRLYPFGTSGIYNAKGEVVGTLSLNWDGENGLYANLWKPWLDFLDKGIPYEWSINLELIDLLKLDTSKQVKIGSNYYLIKSLAVDLPLEKAATVTMVRI